MQTFLQDLRYGVRMLIKNPGFAAVAVNGRGFTIIGVAPANFNGIDPGVPRDIYGWQIMTLAGGCDASPASNLSRDCPGCDPGIQRRKQNDEQPDRDGNENGYHSSGHTIDGAACHLGQRAVGNGSDERP